MCNSLVLKGLIRKWQFTQQKTADMILAMEFQKHLSNASYKHDILDHGKHKKRPRLKKWTKRDYRVQHNKDVYHQYVKMCCATNQLPGFKVIGLHNKQHCLIRLGKNYFKHFCTKLGHGTCAIRCIPCACPQ